MTLTVQEKDRTVEILFYLFFSKKDPAILKNIAFWQAIKFVCEAYGVDSSSVQRAVSLLAQPANEPDDIELWFLLNKLGCTVRPIYKMTGIYYEKQIICKNHVENFGDPAIIPRIKDTALKAAMRTFLYASRDFFGTLRYLDYRDLDKFFGTT